MGARAVHGAALVVRDWPVQAVLAPGSNVAADQKMKYTDSSAIAAPMKAQLWRIGSSPPPSPQKRARSTTTVTWCRTAGPPDPVESIREFMSHDDAVRRRRGMAIEKWVLVSRRPQAVGEMYILHPDSSNCKWQMPPTRR